MKEKIRQLAGTSYELPKASLLSKIFERFSLGEKVIFTLLFMALTASSLSLLSSVNTYFTTEVPKKGGSLREGVIGSPRFINPLLSTTDADRDLTSLVYSGLLRATPEGELIPDLASHYEISEDGLTYTFFIRERAVFHDNTPVTARDVAFTIAKAQDPSLKSPKRANWDSVSLEVVSDREIRFYLKSPYAPFLENATIGIVPEHIWKDASTEEFALSRFNLEPIGSGPYKVSSIKRDSIGIPVRYTLSMFEKFTLGSPFLEEITLSFYPNQQELFDAYERDDIDSLNGLSPERLSIVDLERSTVIRSTLPRIFAIFFNQNKAPVFTNVEVREALDAAIDKERLVNEVLGGYGSVSFGPLPEGVIKRDAVDSTQSDHTTRATEILEDASWKKGEDGIFTKKTKASNYELSFSISTSNAPELKKAALILKEMWEAIGAKVEVKIFETGDLNQNVIRPRDYDTLFFGLVVGRDLDLFAFWHSSQRNDPGLNVALYTNSTADKLLSEARKTSSRKERLLLYKQFEEELLAETPAIFLYSPDFIYITSKEIKGVEVGSLTTPSERFLTVYRWYKDTERVWSIFE